MDQTIYKHQRSHRDTRTCASILAGKNRNSAQCPLHNRLGSDQERGEEKEMAPTESKRAGIEAFKVMATVVTKQMTKQI